MQKNFGISYIKLARGRKDQKRKISLSFRKGIVLREFCKYMVYRETAVVKSISVGIIELQFRPPENKLP